MAETVKKKSSPAKTTTKTAEAKTTPSKARATATRKKAPAANVTEISVSHETVAQLAHRFWAERGRQHGHHVEDWLRAEQELRKMAS